MTDSVVSLPFSFPTHERNTRGQTTFKRREQERESPAKVQLKPRHSLGEPNYLRHRRVDGIIYDLPHAAPDRDTQWPG